MAWNATGKLFSGLVVGAAVGATLAVVLSSRAGVALPRSSEHDQRVTGPTPFEPANALIERARSLVEDVRMQIRQAVDEGKRTAAATRQDLTARFEAAKRGTPYRDES